MTKLSVYCHPLSIYHEPPTKKDNYELEGCPDCNNLMWISERKRELLRVLEDVFLICMLCFDEKVQSRELGSL